MIFSCLVWYRMSLAVGAGAIASIYLVRMDGLEASVNECLDTETGLRSSMSPKSKMTSLFIAVHNVTFFFEVWLSQRVCVCMVLEYMCFA